MLSQKQACVQQRAFRAGNRTVHPVSRRANVKVMAASGTLKVMISGAPAAGKGTQCAKIVEKYNLVHISVGDLLRDEVSRSTPIGKKAKEFMDKGVLVPDEVVVDMVKARLAEEDVQKKGWLLDGYPRSAPQAEAIEKANIKPDAFLLINVPDDVLVERVVGRRLDPKTGDIYHIKFKPAPIDVAPRLIQRSDDSEDKCRVRLATYNANVKSVVGFYKNKLVEINGNRDMDVVFEDICKAIDATLAKIDPLEAFCAQNADADECRVYSD